jgi:hypothetical protein
METSFTIPLDTDWFCTYILLEGIGDGHAVIPQLSEWTFRSKFMAEHWPPEVRFSAWFWREFDLEPTNYCVRYFLHIDSTPGEISVIFLNRKEHVAVKQSGPLAIDVTDYVMLEGNKLSLRLDPSTAQLDRKFSGVRLEAVPCE